MIPKIDRLPIISKGGKDYTFCPLDEKNVSLNKCRVCPLCRHVTSKVSCEWQFIPEEFREKHGRHTRSRWSQTVYFKNKSKEI